MHDTCHSVDGGRGAGALLDQPMVFGLYENGGTRDLYEDDARDLCGNVLFRFANEALPK